MLLFSGKGYDDEFAANMSFIIGELRNNPNELLILVKGFDDICLHCPNLSEDKQCQLGNEDVLKKDDFVLSKLRLETHRKYTYKEILTNIAVQMTDDCFSSCCNNCRWFKMNYCSYEELIKNSKLYYSTLY